MKKIRIFTGLILLTLLLPSCRSYKNISYLQGMDEGDIIQLAEKLSATINDKDVLSITVSTANPETVAGYNPMVLGTAKSNDMQLYSAPVLQSYTVGTDGCIDFPTLGHIKVAGLTRQQLEEYLKDEISSMVLDPIVKVQILTNNITVLGEVTTPGTFSIPNDRLSLFEALGMAQDLTIYGRRDNILIARENGEGSITSIRVDITKPDVFSSEGFYLQKGDVVYVEPNEYKKSNSRYNSNKQFNVSMISAIISGCSVIATLAVAIATLHDSNSSSGD
ncbi:MAG: polysaccharide biosynthesis/export family protein [Porphyromonadaceae bacterium]|nr:polysaccharide biosynthesis/export family protein [Porphyromonadaceae bacterium]MCD8288240.1 polysaccharide biosynthesis/export family protein [Porphyromonadaceae bacterium]